MPTPCASLVTFFLIAEDHDPVGQVADVGEGKIPVSWEAGFYPLALRIVNGTGNARPHAGDRRAVIVRRVIPGLGNAEWQTGRMQVPLKFVPSFRCGEAARTPAKVV